MVLPHNLIGILCGSLYLSIEPTGYPTEGRLCRLSQHLAQ